MIHSGTDPSAVAEAARLIRSGELIGLPTETVYGLGADASNDAAVVHIAEAQQVRDYASSVPPFACRLIAAFWPGPLTLILPRKPGVATAAAGGQNSIGLRCPSHPVAQALLKACRTGVAGPSANRFGRVSPTTATHVADELGGALFVLDGGPCDVGIESTIVDCTRGQPVLLRPGVLTRAQLEAACGEQVLDNQALASDAPRASGTLASHYAPNAKVRLMDKSELQVALAALQNNTDAASSVAVYAYSIPIVDAVNEPSVLYRAMPLQVSEVAHELFAVLREFDAQGVTQLWVETLPATTDWDGVRDRLTRAAVQP